jgi:hypothetical protein
MFCTCTIVLHRGWRPSYRNVLLQVRNELGVQCSSKLCTADLEAEIFLHLLDEYSRYLHLWESIRMPIQNLHGMYANGLKLCNRTYIFCHILLPYILLVNIGSSRTNVIPYLPISPVYEHF